MLRSMTGFGRYYMEEQGLSQTWEIRSVNSRHLDLKWRLPQAVRSLEQSFEKTVRRFAARGRVEISLNLHLGARSAGLVTFNADQAEAVLEALGQFADARGDEFDPDYNRLLSLSWLWDQGDLESEGELADFLERGLASALEDWNESRQNEARLLAQDIKGRILRMEEWVSSVAERAPDIKEARFAQVRERLNQVLAEYSSSLDEGRFLQEITIMADKMDVSEELTRLSAHLERLNELMDQGKDAGRRLDFTMQECFREINTLGNKIQDAQISRLVVDFKNELEKCREQVQNIE